ncbi:MAG: Fur family transcriptional regulator [Gammaproteobacteria bacterium]
MPGDLTPNQQVVLTLLQRASVPLGAYELLEKSRFGAPTQVYRALACLVDLGLVRRIESMNAYIACAPSGSDATPAVTICDRCGHVDEQVDPSVQQMLATVTQSLGFVAERVAIEMHGTCAACQTQNEGKTDT